MGKTKFIYYQEGNKWVGWLEDYPDYRTQGTTLDELKENLKDIYEDLATGMIFARKCGDTEMVVPLTTATCWDQVSLECH